MYKEKLFGWLLKQILYGYGSQRSGGYISWGIALGGIALGWVYLFCGYSPWFGMWGNSSVASVQVGIAIVWALLLFGSPLYNRRSLP